VDGQRGDSFFACKQLSECIDDNAPRVGDKKQYRVVTPLQQSHHRTSDVTDAHAGCKVTKHTLLDPKDGQTP
jgi:hypothetical protein